MPDPTAAQNLSANDERTREDKQEPPSSETNVTQKEKVDASLKDHSSSLINEKAVTRHCEEGAQAREEVPLGSKMEEHEVEGEKKKQ